MPRKSLLLIPFILILAACTSSYQYHPYIGDPVIYEGTGGAVEVVDGATIWIKGTPNRRYSVIGYLDGEYTDEWLMEDDLKKSIAAKVKELGADAALLNERRKSPGDSYVVGYSVVTDINVHDEYLIIKYQD